MIKKCLKNGKMVMTKWLQNIKIMTWNFRTEIENMNKWQWNNEKWMTFKMMNDK